MALVEGTLFCRACASDPNTLALPRRGRVKPAKRRGGRPFGEHTWRSFEKARAFVRSLGLKNVTTEWRAWVAGHLPGKPPKPDDIPSSPDQVYRNDGWVSWGDFLGTGHVGPGLKKWRSYARARAFARKLRLKNFFEWLAYTRGDIPDKPPRPEDVPATPAQVYTSRGEWKGWGDFLGTGNLSKTREFRPFDEARAFARSLGLRTHAEWAEYTHGKRRDLGRLPPDISPSPWVTYREQWKGIGDWLGTGVPAPKDRKYRPFARARAWIRRQGIKNQKEWREFTAGAPNNRRLPPDIPATPWNVYADEWRGLADWLGTARRGR